MTKPTSPNEEISQTIAADLNDGKNKYKISIYEGR